VLKKSVAVLDIRSSEVCAVVGERGVNNTFIIKSKYSCNYEGYEEGVLLDENSFFAAIGEVVKSTLSCCGRRINTFYVSVPGEFLKVVCGQKAISFPAPKKITKSNVEQLISVAQPNEEKSYSTIYRSPIYYMLADKRRVIDPVGIVSDTLSGRISYFRCKNYFIEKLKTAFLQFSGISNLNLIPQNLAEALYLIQPDDRDAYSVLFDLGFISSTYSIVCGNGIVFSESFSLGVGHIAVLLMSRLDIPYEVALTFLGKVNLNAKEKLTTIEEYKYDGKMYSFSTSALRDIIREGLDGICETIDECRQVYIDKHIDGKPILATGEGIKAVRGLSEHLASRLETPIEVIAPKLPFYDKPQFSSLFSLLAIATGK
jgi:cell division protein FtsA